MSFEHPLILALILVPLALYAWEARRLRLSPSAHGPKILRGETTQSRISYSMTDAASSPARARIRLHAGILLVIVALARPQWGKISEPVFDQSREIIVAVDLSRSMLATDVKPTRLDRSKLLFQSLLERLDGERVGLLVFSGTAFLQCPLSSDYEILREFLPELDPGFLPEGGSNYQAMLETAVRSFTSTSAADRFLIVLSDGEATDDAWERTVDTLKTMGIRAICLGVGTSEGSMVPDSSGGFVKDERGAVVLSRLESATLRSLAERTQGVYSDASSWVDLAAILKETVEAGKKGEFRETSHVRLAERFQWALAPGVLFLIWSFFREFPVRPKPRAMTLARSHS